ncbi:hypothetical protein ACB092_03G018500 [Castanea dentata]
MRTMSLTAFASATSGFPAYTITSYNILFSECITIQFNRLFPVKESIKERTFLWSAATAMRKTILFCQFMGYSELIKWSALGLKLGSSLRMLCIVFKKFKFVNVLFF